MEDNPDFDISQLSASQQEALQQYTQVTGQDLKDAVPLLERSQWNVQIAITKFFDGEGPDPLADAMVADAAPPVIAQRHDNIQESFMNPAAIRSPRGARPDPAPRIVPQSPVVRNVPFIFSIIFAPVTLGYRAVATLFKTVFYVLSLIPFPVRGWLMGTGAQPLKKNATGRRMLMPRDTAARFKREFDEEYGDNDLPFYEGGFAQALDLAKKDLKFLVIVLLSPEHDETDDFVRETLLSADVTNFVKDPSNNIILWGGSVLDTEAFQVSLEYNCTKFPFSAIISLTPKEGSTKMGVIKRLAGPLPVSTYSKELRKAIEKHAPELSGVRAQRREHEMSRNLRNAQDEAYERSLAADRERARQRREAEAIVAATERAARDAAEAAERLKQQQKQWKKWRSGQIKAEPETNNKDVVRVAIKMPSGERVVRRFESTSNLEELYAFVECFEDICQGGDSSAAKPEDYTHEYKFRVASIMPREVYDPDDDGTLREKIGRSGNLIVEYVEEADNAE